MVEKSVAERLHHEMVLCLIVVPFEQTPELRPSFLPSDLFTLLQAFIHAPPFSIAKDVRWRTGPFCVKRQETMSDPSRDTLASLLIEISRMLEMKGENPFKIRAYTKAARAVEMFGGDLTAEATAGRLEAIDGIGKAIAEKLTEWLTTGRMVYYDQLREEFPPEIFELFDLSGLGAKKIKALRDKLRVGSISSLERACRAGQVAGLEGFGEKSEQRLLEAIEDRRKNQGQYRLGQAAPWAETLLDWLRQQPAVLLVEACGSYRRRKEVVKDLDFVAATRDAPAVTAAFTEHSLVEKIVLSGPTKTSVRLTTGIQADLRLVEPEAFPFAVQYFTGSKEHNVAIRARARTRGWTLNEYRLAVEPGATAAIPEIRSEAELYRALDLEWIPPELREDHGEIAAAEAGTLPRLVEWENLRGIFHNHTTESDGRNSLEEMVAGARELGLAYYGVADHSKSSFQARGLTADRLLAQVEAVRALDAQLDDITLFAGVECDILKDGTLDYPDDVLAQLDYVVGSVHGSFSMSEAEMTARIIRAMENPYITMIGHLTGRLLLSRPSYAVDIPAILEAAARTGTWIELNANPKRLDMDWRWWRKAAALGVRCVINPDAHSVDGLRDLWFGVCAARKGWLRREDVVNCLSLSEIREALLTKRRQL